MKFRMMDSAPKDGTRVRLRIVDIFGARIALGTWYWSKETGEWCRYSTGTPLTPTAVAWSPIA